MAPPSCMSLGGSLLFVYVLSVCPFGYVCGGVISMIWSQFVTAVPWPHLCECYGECASVQYQCGCRRDLVERSGCEGLSWDSAAPQNSKAWCVAWLLLVPWYGPRNWLATAAVALWEDPTQQPHRDPQSTSTMRR